MSFYWLHIIIYLLYYNFNYITCTLNSNNRQKYSVCNLIQVWDLYLNLKAMNLIRIIFVLIFVSIFPLNESQPGIWSYIFKYFNFNYCESIKKLLTYANFRQKLENVEAILEDFTTIIGLNYVKNSYMEDVMAMKIDLKQKKNVIEYASSLIRFMGSF